MSHPRIFTPEAFTQKLLKALEWMDELPTVCGNSRIDSFDLGELDSISVMEIVVVLEELGVSLDPLDLRESPSMPALYELYLEAAVAQSIDDEAVLEQGA